MKMKSVIQSILAVGLCTALFISVAIAETPTSGFNYKIPESIRTPNQVETSIGKLDFYDGLPSKATSEKIFDYLDTARGMEVFLSAIPMASVEAMRLANVEMGVTSSNNVLIFDDLMDSAPLFLTGNTDTVMVIKIIS